MEHEQLEYKREYTDKIIHTIIAFANTSGGTIIIGMEDDGTVVGVEHCDELMLKISSKIKDSIEPDMAMLCSVEAVEVDGKILVKIMVQNGTHCPYYLKSKGPVPSFESATAIIQDLTFHYATAYFEKKSVPFKPENLGLLHTDGSYSNLGLICSNQCPYSIKIAIFQGDSKDIFKDKQELSGSIFRQIEEAYQIVDRHNRTFATIQGLHRVEQRDYPEVSLREALINAVIHRDYAYSAPIIINIFDSSLEIISVGDFMRGFSLEEALIGLSIQRNEKCAGIFQRLKLMEAYGTGLLRIFQSYQGFQLQPEVIATKNAFKIIIPSQIPH